MQSKLPPTWRSEPLGALAKRVRRRVEGVPEHILMITSTGGFIAQEDKYSRFMAGDSLKNYVSLRRGEFAYNKGNSKTYPQGCIYRLDAWEVAAVPNVYISFRVASEELDSDFAVQFFGNGGLNRQLERVITSGARSNGLLNLSVDDFFACEVPLPPLPEQKKIAAILSSVDEAIQATQAVIEQTRRVKEGLLQDLLTRGIGHTRFKQTEIGEIPESWELVRVSDAVSHIIDYRGKTPPYSESGVPVISQEDVQATGLMPSQKWVSHETASQWKHRGTLEPGDVVFRMERFVGEVAQVPDEQLYIITRGVLALRPAPALFVKDYFFWLFFHKKRCGDWDKHGHATTVPRMYKPDLLAQSLPRPPIQEQKLISAQMESVEKLIAAEVAKLRPLRRVKAGLLQDLLTGKVRVSP